MQFWRTLVNDPLCISGSRCCRLSNHVTQIIKSLVLPFIFEAVPLEEARDLTGDVLAADRDCYASSSVIAFVMDLYRHLLS